MSNAHPWYGTARWQKARMRQLREHPMCRFCEQQGILTPADTADHVTPHRGDKHLFWHGELQSLCANCHNTTKKKMEIRGYDDRFGVDGIPLDPNHPFNARE